LVGSRSHRKLQGNDEHGQESQEVLIVGWMPQAGIEVLKKRDDVDYEILPLADVLRPITRSS
jgi:hypothetical protein